MASALLAARPLVVVFLFFQRQISKGIATTGFGGQQIGGQWFRQAGFPGRSLEKVVTVSKAAVITSVPSGSTK